MSHQRVHFHFLFLTFRFLAFSFLVFGLILVVVEMLGGLICDETVSGIPWAPPGPCWPAGHHLEIISVKRTGIIPYVICIIAKDKTESSLYRGLHLVVHMITRYSSR